MATRMDFFMIPRRFFAPGAFKAEPYSKREALLDLIQMAAYEDKEILVNGEALQTKRGQVLASVRFLAKKWGWSVSKVHRTLIAFQSEHFIERDTNGVIASISICNYDLYSGGCNTLQNADRNTDDSGIGTNPRIKKKEKRENDANASKEREEAVGRLYALYPSSVTRADGNKVTLKSIKDKEKLVRLLATHSEAELANTIKRYLEGKPGAYIRMFATFLNNLPDYSEPEHTAEQPPVQQETSLWDQIQSSKGKPQDA